MNTATQRATPIPAPKPVEASPSQNVIQTLCLLTANLPGMAYHCPPKAHGLMEFVSDGCVDLTGHSVIDLLDNAQISYASLIDPGDRAAVQQEVAAAVKEERPYRLTYRIRTAGGKVRWVSDTGRLMPTTGGRAPAIGGFITDITESKLTEETLHQRSALLQLQQIVATAANEAQTVEDALQTGLDLIGAYTGCSVGHVHLLPDANGRQHIRPNLWYLQEPKRFAAFVAATERIPDLAKDGLLARVISTGMVSWVETLTSEPNFRRAMAATQVGLRSGVAIPIWAGKTVAGVLEFYSTAPLTVDGRWLDVMNYVGMQLGRVIERKQADSLLRTSEERFRVIAENIRQVFWMSTPDMSQIYYVSPAFEEIWGTPSTRLYARPTVWQEAIHPEDLDRVCKVMRAKRQEGFSMEYRIIRPDQSIRWIWDRSFPVRNDAGVIDRLVGVAEDITNRIHAEEALRQSEQEFRELFENSPDAIFVEDLQGVVLDANPAACRLKALTHEQLVGRNVSDLVPSDQSEQVARDFQKWFTGEMSHYEGQSRSADGKTSPVEVRGVPIRFRGHAAVLLHVRDITDRKKMSEQLLESNQRLRHTLDELRQTQEQVIQHERLSALGSMASGIAHDFNNSLTSILGFTELLLHRPGSLDDKPKVRRYLEVMNTAAQDAAYVVSRLRKFYSHREQNEILTPLDLNHLVQETIAITQPKWKIQTEATGITIRVTTDLQPIPAVLGNTADLREGLTNLIFNAVDAMAQGGTLTLRTCRRENDVCLDVIDTGTGMSEETVQHCFEPFFTTKGERGTGLGLAMVYGIIQRHNGRIEVQSSLGQGSHFTIFLPVPAETAANIDHTNIPGTLRALRILLVDDEPEIRYILGEFMRSDGHTVVTAADGQDAMNQFGPDLFDVVVMDRAMPTMNGDQLAIAIKAVAPRLPVIMLTGFGAMMRAANEHPPGVDYIISKPVTMQLLREALAIAVRPT